MRSRHLAAVLLLAAHACSDPPFPDDVWESSATEPGDGSLAPPGCPTPAWSCQQIGDCADACGTNLDCMSACEQEGCEISRQAFVATSSCAASRCLGDCLGGFSEDCQRCMDESCAQESARCEIASCPSSCADVPADDPTGQGSDDRRRAPGDGPSSCFEIYECAGACGDDDCLEGCVDGGCRSARDAFSAMQACADSACGPACRAGLSAGCVGCVITNCEGPWTDCTDDVCAP